MLGLNSSIIVRKNPYDFTEGNPGLKPEKSYQTTVAAMYFSRGLSWSVDATYTHTDHPIMYDVVYSDGRFTTATMRTERGGDALTCRASRASVCWAGGCLLSRA